MQNIKRAQSEALSQRLSKLSADKKLMFRSKLKQEGIDAWQLPIVPEFEASEFRKLSYSQQRLWFIDEMEAGKGLYNISFALSITGLLDYELLNQSVNDIIQRHHVLRTNVHNVNGEGRQTVRDFESLKFIFLDSPKSEDHDEVKLQAIIAQEAETPFDLKNASHMMRITLVKRSGKTPELEHVAVLSFHHISFDAFSVGLFVDELQQGYAFYQANGIGDRSHAESLDDKIRLQYADYAYWHSQWLESDAADGEAKYWKEQLADAPQQTIVPTCHKRPENMTYAGNSEFIRLSPKLSEQVESLIRTEGVTFYMIMLAVFNVLLSRQTGQNDILVGTSIANRSRIETERLLGVFVNTLVMRNKLGDETTFQEFLQEVKRTSTDAYTNQELPFDKVVDVAGVERVKNISPLFQVLFVVNNALDSVSISLNDIEVAAYDLESQYARFDLTLRVAQETLLSEEPGIFCAFEYNTALFSKERIADLLTQYEHLLAQIVDNVKQPLASLSLLNYEQQHEVQLKGIEQAVTQTNTIHGVVELRAISHASDLAVVSGDEKLSYEQLNKKANQLANRLLQNGVTAEQHVGIFLDRSVDYIVSLLGILKAGCAYVPLDKSWPLGRLKVIASDAELVCIVSDAQSQDSLSGMSVSVLLGEDSSAFDSNNPMLDISTRQSAYLIYTSGSTGAPKGVVVEHAQVQAYAKGLTSTLGVGGLHFASVSSVATDLGNTAIFGALCSGGILNLVSEDCLRDADALANYLSDHKVDVLKITPSYLQGLISAAHNSVKLLPKHTLILGGERCTADLAAQIQTLSPACQLINHYGPTETTVGALTFMYSPEQLDSIAASTDSLPVGTPLPNYTAMVVDQYNHPCPIKTPGELVIGGAGVSRGYYGQQEMTAEKFTLDSWGNRCYKTGDRARLLANGNIEFLGRTDDQIKIRGYRVELADIEYCLKQQSNVSNAIVRFQPSETSQRLVAYVVLDTEGQGDDKEPVTQSLLDHLAENLPEYMIPQQLHLLNELPLTINGKVDTKALEAILLTEKASGEKNRVALEPTNEIEKSLMAIWSTLLKQDNFGIDDNFFELGGDSILSLQVIAGAKRAGYKLMPKQLFEHQTIAGLASIAKPLEGSNDKSTALNDAAVTGDVVISPIQRWFLNSEHSVAHHWNQSVSLQAKEPINAEALELAVSALVRHHDQLRCEFLLDDFIASQRVLTWDLDKGKQYYCSDNSKTRSFAEGANDWQGRLSFAADNGVGQLFKLVHFLGDETTPDRVLLVAHHLLVDGISWRVLSEDLLTAYQHALAIRSLDANEQPDSAMQRPDFPSKTVSFQSWSKALKGASEQTDSSWQLESRRYWGDMSKQLSNDHPLIMPRNLHASLSEVSTLSVNLNQQQTQALIQAAPKAYKTRINDLLLSALSLAVAKQLADQPLYLELEGHGREELTGSIEGVDVSRTVGWFTSRFPILLEADASETCDLGGLIRSIKEQLRAIPSNGLAYGVLTNLGDLTPLAKPTISFNYLGQIDGTQEALSQAFEAVPDAGKIIERHPDNRVTHGLSINAIVANNELRISFQSASKLLNLDELNFDVSQLSNDYLAALEQLIDHCSGGALGFTPSDFPLANVSQNQLDTLADKVGVDQVENIYGLTSLQEGMLFHSLLNKDSDDASAYFNQLLVKVEGQFDAITFAKAWQLTLNRHSILRSSFWVEGANEPVQIVHKDSVIPVDHQNLRSLSAIEKAETINSYIVHDRQLGFDLQKAPLVRVGLFELDDLHWQVLWSRHHLLLDGWSSTRLLQEVMASYQALSKSIDINTHPLLSQKPAPFSKYIEWLQKQDSSKAEHFWKDYLNGLQDSPLISLKRDCTIQSSYNLKLSSELSQKIIDLSKLAQVTTNTVMQAAWGLLLSQYISSDDNDQHDLMFGMTSAGRSMDLAAIQEMLGLFINTLPVRLSLDFDQNLTDYLKGLQLNQASVREFEYVSLSQIQSCSEIDNSQPLFESLLIFENYMVDDQALKQLQDDEDKLRLSTVSNHETTNYPITLVIVPGSDQLELRFSSNGIEFNDLERLANGYQATLEAMANSHIASIKIGELVVLPKQQKQQLIHDWNATDKTFQSASIETLISQYAALNGNATAVSFTGIESESEQLTYAELEEKSNQLAHTIQAQGIGKNQLVGIAQHRSTSLLVSILAVLKAGAAYVPLDPNYPQDRIDYMIEDANLNLLLCDQGVSDRALLPRDISCPVMNIDNIELAEKSKSIPTHSALADDLAYVIYTSGSTGKPKGVQITRGNLSNFVFGMVDLLSPTISDRLLALTSLSFDIAALELFLPLVSGGQVVIGDEGLSMDGPRLNGVIESGITMMQATPVSWKLLLASGWQHNDSSPSFTALCGGEAFPVDLAHELLERPIKVWNMYGPTETTVWSTAYELSENADEINNTVPVGRPIANTQLFVLDKELKTVPIGVTGELYIGGAGVAKGYLGKDELTSERFVSTEFGRLYQTGDLVRYRENGVLECLGRLDNQVKIRGYRIELGEVEQALLQHQDLIDVAVQAVVLTGQPILVAYVVTKQSMSEEQEAQLSRELLKQINTYLPAYMVPSMFVTIDSLPLTPNGKVDRKALPAPDLAGQRSDYEPPETDLQAQLCEIWQELLNVERVGLHDNFFALGGHSLLAIRLKMRLSTDLGVDLSIAQMLSNQSVSLLASVVESYQEKISEGDLDWMNELMDDLED
jgi:amino acid adenylation domain-containing protein/non-ribosomal peptide synthase protein (TIGR01720 family)